MKVFLDTNVLVAACVQEHEHHTRALPLVQAVHSRVHEGVVSGHGILEVYAILTRLPRSPRTTPAQAGLLVQENIVKHFAIIALGSREYAALSSKLARRGIWGGRTYDALHLACAEKGGADQIFTFNVHHFADLAPHLSARIVAP